MYKKFVGHSQSNAERYIIELTAYVRKEEKF